MDPNQRLRYLNSMGIDVWVRRQKPEEVFPPAIGSFHTVSSCNSLSVDLGLETANYPIQSNIAAGISDLASSTGSYQIATLEEDSWGRLQNQVAVCRNCVLHETRTQTVFGTGSHNPGLMLIGEAPGQDEDLQGEPFVGKAGQLLNEMIRAIGFKRQEVYIANILKCRPPKNRDPQAAEVNACNYFLLEQIRLLQPKLIIAVGRIAAQNLLKTEQSLGKLRGTIHQFDNTPVVVIHHPAYLLRSPHEKAKAWEDLQFALTVYHDLENKYVETATQI
jgi:uracil-DNA glycosylase